MADENLEGLEGLDDFGDDFGDQLDTFMEGDEEEGDSELDSFFEDLSTIDDLEMKEEETSEPEASTEEPPTEEPEEAAEEPEEAAEEPEEAATEPEEAPAAAAAAPAAEEKPAEKKKEEKKPAKAAKPKKEKKSGPRKPILIAALITSVIGMVLGAITVGILYFLNMPEGVPEELAEQPEEPPAPVAAFKEPEPEPKPTSEPVAKTEPKPAVKKPAKQKSNPNPATIPKGTRFYVQVANCVFDDCVQDYRSLLKKHGYKSRVVKNSDTSFLAEVISSQPLKDEASTKLVNRINRSNREAGQAYRKKTEKGYMVSLGLFPNLETAGRVRNFLNQAYGKETFFDIRRGEDKISYQQVQAGGYRTKKQAESLRKLLGRKDKNFEDAFIVAVKR